jgi:hypothetical protein
MRVLVLAAIAAAMCAVGCASGESYVAPSFYQSGLDSVAVVDVQGDVPGEGVANQIASYFEFELVKKGYRVVERSRVDTLLKEQEFQRSGVTTPEGAAQAGRILNVQGLLVADVDAGENISITAKIIGVEDGAILWIAQGEATTGRTLATVGGAATGAALGIWAGGNRTGKVVGGVAGAAVGGTAGYMLTPQEASQIRKAIRKICEDLPPPPR